MSTISDKPSLPTAPDTQNMRSSFANILTQSRRQSAPEITHYQGIEVRDYRTDTAKSGLYQWHLQDQDFPDQRAMPLSANSKHLSLIAKEEMPEGVEKAFIAHVDRPTVAVKNWMNARTSGKQKHTAYPDVLSLGMAKNPDAHLPQNPKFLADPRGNNQGALPDELRMDISKYVQDTYHENVSNSAQEFADIADFYALVINKPQDELRQNSAEYTQENKAALGRLIDGMISKRKAKRSNSSA